MFTKKTTKNEAKQQVVDKKPAAPAKKVSIGLDHGNGFVKAMSDSHEFILPSQLARSDEFSGENYGTKGKRVSHYRNLKDGEQSQQYSWGEDVSKAKYPIKTYATEDRYTKKPYSLLTSFALGELVKNEPSSQEAVVVTGVPSYEKGTKLEEELNAVFLGKHEVDIDGIRREISVKEVRIVPQPLGTLLYHYLDNDGYVLDDKFESNDFYSGIIDIGSGTTDLDGLKELEVVSKDRYTIRKGMFDAYDEIASYIKEQDPRADIDKEKLERWIRMRESLNLNPYLYNPTSKIFVDFKKAAENAFQKLAEDIIVEIDQRWNKSHFNEIYLTGGGATVLSKYFKEWDPDILIVDNHQMANAIGFYRFAKYLQTDH